jgi:hypothetical protein
MDLRVHSPSFSDSSPFDSARARFEQAQCTMRALQPSGVRHPILMRRTGLVRKGGHLRA